MLKQIRSQHRKLLQPQATPVNLQRKQSGSIGSELCIRANTCIRRHPYRLALLHLSGSHMLLTCGLRLNHERHKHAGSRKESPRRGGAYASLLLLGFCRGHHLQRQVPKFLPPFRAAIALCEDVVTITTSIVAATCAVATTTSGPTVAASSVATSTYTFDDISTKP